LGNKLDLNSETSFYYKILAEAVSKCYRFKTIFVCKLHLKCFLCYWALPKVIRPLVIGSVIWYQYYKTFYNCNYDWSNKLTSPSYPNVSQVRLEAYPGSLALAYFKHL